MESKEINHNVNHDFGFTKIYHEHQGMNHWHHVNITLPKLDKYWAMVIGGTVGIGWVVGIAYASYLFSLIGG